MGILELLKNAAKGRLGRPQVKGEKDLKCPKCKKPVTLDMERCPGCGTHISSMFRIECPACKEPNPLAALSCGKCGKSFISSGPTVPGSTYVCPLCGYRADYYMLSCPACGVKFI